MRKLAAQVIWGAIQDPPPAGLMGRLPALQQYFERHEPLLSIRVAWMAGYHLANLSEWIRVGQALSVSFPAGHNVAMAFATSLAAVAGWILALAGATVLAFRRQDIN